MQERLNGLQQIEVEVSKAEHEIENRKQDNYVWIIPKNLTSLASL